MAKRNSDGDVLANQVNVMLANQQRTLAALLGSNTEHESRQEAVREEHQEDDLKGEALGYDRLGVGGYVPKDIQDGSFTKRTMISKDKLLEQLMGRKAAKAHIAAKQAPRTATQAPGPGKPSRTAKPGESDDDEEGRAAMFKSKRRKTARSNMADDERPVTHQETSFGPTSKPTGTESEHHSESQEPSDIASKQPRQGASDLEDETPKKHQKKPSSYLDEVLAERSKKKNKRKGKKDTT